MFVMNASFEIETEHEDRLRAKAEKSKAENTHAPGIRSFEVWRKDHGQTVEYLFVSKWDSEADFKAWISREAHVEEHKAMHKHRKENPETVQVKMKKTLRSYEVLEL